MNVAMAIKNVIQRTGSKRTKKHVIGVHPEEEVLRREASLSTLELVFRWAIAKSPAFVPDDVVIQDEYTHDVLFRRDERTYLVFDTT